ncbi:ABC transporter ATP-binding protein [Nodularia chucula]|uniref:ABC transporter ATP-binding protein n=1 Tax=Nodularia chucula TaxID=3093667 RepID=UPI0039C5D30E
MKTLEAHQLQKTFSQSKQMITAVKDVSLNIHPHEVLAFLGPNGAGKTTSIKMIAGLIQPDAGWVKIAGTDPHRNPTALQNLGAVLEGNRNLYWRLTPQENLEYFGVLKGLSRREATRSGLALLDRFGLMSKRQTAVENLSRGMQQKLAFAVALVHKPQLLLLDEPTLGLDVEATEDVKILVKEIAAAGCAILLTTHQLSIAEELADRVAIIQSGEIITELSTSELIRQFSGTGYKIQVETVLDDARISALENLGTVVQDTQIIHLSQPELLYKILDIIKPLPISSLEKEQANLTQIFLRIIRKGRNQDA